MTLIYLTIAWLCGIVLARLLTPSLYLLAAFVLVGLAILLLYARASRERLWAALVIAVALGGCRYLLAQSRPDAGDVAYYNDGGEVVLRGYVSAEPNQHSTYTQLELTVEELEREGQHYTVRGKVVCNVPLYPAWEYGDRLRLAGRLETPPVTEDFTYREQLAAQGIHSSLRWAQAEGLGQRRASWLMRWILRRKSELHQVLETILPNPDAGLLAGILLGLGHTLPADLAQAFRTVGLTHIIVISGANISLVIQAVMFASQRFLHRLLALGLSLGAIIFFALFVGPSPPVARATLMGCLMILGQVFGRRSHALTSLAATALFMSAVNPLSVWQVSFQLSFVAALALVAFEPILERGLAERLRKAMDGGRAAKTLRLVRQVLLTTLAAQLLTLPILWYHFGEVSLISLLANILVLPIQPFLMAAGFVALFAGVMWQPLGTLAGWALWPLSRYCVLVIQNLARVPWAAFQAPHPSSGMVLGFYGLLGLSVSHEGRQKALNTMRRLLSGRHVTQAILVTLTLAVVLVWSAVAVLPDGKLHVYFLDVGQGDAILIRTPGGRVLLVDGGPDPVLLSSRLGQVLPFWQRRIDLLAVTHTDQDHLLGLIPLLQRYRAGQILEPPALDQGKLAEQWRAATSASGAQVVRLTQGMTLNLGEGLQVEVLQPPAPAPEAPTCEGNRCSLVLRLVMGRCRVLLTADMDTSREQELNQSGQPLDALVLKVSHHGAASATSTEFLATVQPQLAVISVGQGNRFGHPTAAVLERLAAIHCQVLRTDLQGTIELVSDGQQLWVKTARNKP